MIAFVLIRKTLSVGLNQHHLYLILELYFLKSLVEEYFLDTLPPVENRQCRNLHFAVLG